MPDATPPICLTLDHQRLHLALYAHCYLNAISELDAAHSIGVSCAALHDLKTGASVSWCDVLLVCLWLDEDPREFIVAQGAEH